MGEKDIWVGDIFVCRWGIIDKIVDFYKVIRRTRKTVVIRKLKNRVVKNLYRNGPAGENLVVPDYKFDKKGDRSEMRKRIQKDGSLRITDRASAYKWDGKPVSEVFGYLRLEKPKKQISGSIKHRLFSLIYSAISAFLMWISLRGITSPNSPFSFT